MYLLGRNYDTSSRWRDTEEDYDDCRGRRRGSNASGEKYERCCSFIIIIKNEIKSFYLIIILFSTFWSEFLRMTSFRNLW